MESTTANTSAATATAAIGGSRNQVGKRLVDGGCELERVLAFGDSIRPGVVRIGGAHSGGNCDHDGP